MTTRYPTLFLELPPLSWSLRIRVLYKLMPSMGQVAWMKPPISHTSSLASNPLGAGFRRWKRLHPKSASYARMYSLFDIHYVFLQQAVRNMALMSLCSSVCPSLSTCQEPETRISEGTSTKNTLRSTIMQFCGINGHTGYRANRSNHYNGLCPLSKRHGLAFRSSTVLLPTPVPRVHISFYIASFRSEVASCCLVALFACLFNHDLSISES